MISKQFSYRISLFLLLLLIFSFGQSGEAAPGQPADSYTLRLFTEDTVLRNPNASVSGYFEKHPGSNIVGPVILDLWYSYSPTTRPDISTITILVNGVPVTSRILEIQKAPMVNWQVPLPPDRFRSGTNEISVAVVHRTIDGLCRDIDNSANWFIIRPDTRISFRVSHSPYNLSSYPRPFLDDYLASKINTVFYLPNDPDHDTLAGLLNLAANWGARGLAGVPQRLEVRIGEPGQVPANEVVLGLTSKWFPGENLPNDASILTLAGLPNGYSRLLITGGSSNSVVEAMDALSRPQLLKTFFGKQMVLASPLPSGTVKAANLVKGKKGLYTLVDLGYQEDIAVTGAFHQETILNIPRPPNYKIGDGSYIELHFHHSKILDPNKSAVTIYINDIPIRATALIAENAEKGILKVPIPVSELNKPLWRVRFGFYHDLGIVDCSKRYDEVAWSVIEKETTIFFEPGQHERIPAWEDFPNSFFVSPNGVINLTMLLPENPTQEEISVAFKLAYYIGQQNKSKIAWQVQTLSSFDDKKALGTVIALGRNGDASQWSALKKYLSVFPEDNGGYHVAPWLEAIPSAMNDLDICQVGKIDSERLLYTFMYSCPERMNDLLYYTLLEGSILTGQLTLIDVHGNHASFTQQPTVAEQSRLEWFNSILQGTGAGGVAGTYLAVFGVVFVATLVLMFLIRHRS